MKLYNTMTRQLEEVPDKNGAISLYTCGPTVYDEPHIGNWRTFVTYDLLKRSLLYFGFEVNHVLNITDVGHLVSDGDEGQDKMVKTAQKERKTAWAIAEHYSQRFIAGMDELNILKPSQLPKATEHIDEQIELVKTLESKGFTYQIDDGVYFDTSKLNDYGKLAKLKLDELKAGARVEVNPQKKNPSDFALWKFSPAGEKRDMEWDSPWGKGFPGWHLECSAMAMKYLGPTIDIHAGGVDHIPVHHTNEIAQSESVTGQPFAKLWVHTEFMKVNDAKIAKSSGNGITLDDVKDHGFQPLDLRMLFLQSHYKTESNFSWDNLLSAANRRKGLRNLAALRWQARKYDSEDEMEILTRTQREIEDALKDDLNTPRALSALAAAEDALDGSLSQNSLTAFDKLLDLLDNTLGLKLKDSTPDIDAESKDIIKKRQQARENKDFALGDELRNKLKDKGIELDDKPDGSSRWLVLN